MQAQLGSVEGLLELHAVSEEQVSHGEELARHGMAKGQRVQRIGLHCDVLREHSLQGQGSAEEVTFCCRAITRCENAVCQGHSTSTPKSSRVFVHDRPPGENVYSSTQDTSVQVFRS